MKRNATKFLLIFILVGVALIPRLWRLMSYPPMIVDEPANIRDIQKILTSHQLNPANFEWGYDKAMAVHYPTIVMILLGIKNQYVALRTTSVVLSLLALLAFYFIVRFYVTSYIAYLSTVLLAASYFFVQFSRVGWTNMLMLTISLWYTWLALLSEKHPTIVRFLLLGVTGGILLYTYRAGELFVAIWCLYLLSSALSDKPTRSQKIEFTFISIIVTFAVALPWIANATSHWDLFTMRQRVVSIFHAPLPYHGLYTMPDIWKYQIVTTARAWIFFIPTDASGVENSRYLPPYAPPINYLLIPLFLIGLGLMGKSFGKFYPWIILYLVSLVGGQILTVDPPNGARALIIVPFMYICIALAMQHIYQHLPFPSRRDIIFGTITVCVAVWDILFYFQWVSTIKLL